MGTYFLSPLPSQSSQPAIIGLPSPEWIAGDTTPSLSEGGQAFGDAMGVIQSATGGIWFHVSKKFEMPMSWFVCASPIKAAFQAGECGKGLVTPFEVFEETPSIARLVTRKS